MKNKEFRMKYDEQAKEIVGKMTLEEKVYLMSGNLAFNDIASKLQEDPLNNHYNVIPYPAGGSDKYNVEPVKFIDGPRGVVAGVGKSTCFPVSMLRGATFNTELETEIGKAIAKEILAFGGNYFGGVCINLPYNPGWGRSQEVYGEESFHLGAMGSALTKGIQEEGVIACIKHYAFNQMENSRFDVSVTCDKRTEREVFLPHFKDCIDAGAASVMSSYNKYNNTYCGHNDYLLNKVLKTEWDFDGFVVSDFIWGVKDTVEAGNGGQDIEMCSTIFFGDKLTKAVEDGFVSEDKINLAATRIVRTMLATTASKNEYSEEVIGCKEHIDLALKTAREGITLVKNENILPLKKDKINKILVLGNLADKENLGDYGSSRVYPPYVKTILSGITDKANSTEIIFNNGENIEYAKKLASEVDNVVYVLGYNYDDEGEYVSKSKDDNYLGAVGGDRQTLGLHSEDINLLNEVGPINKNSTAILIGGNMIMMSDWIDNISSVIMAYYPGMEGGTAVADILFGDVNPSGKLPFVVPKDEKDLPYVDWFADTQYYEYYHGYARLEKNNIEPLYDYGYGLSYTSFIFDNIKLEVKDDKLIGICTVKNTGNIKGTEVAQLYVGFKNSKIDRPVKILRGFDRVTLNPNEEKEVSISVSLDKLNYFNSVLNKWEFENMDYEVYIGNSANNKDLISDIIKISK